MDLDKKKHIAAGFAIAAISGLALLIAGFYGSVIQIGNLPFGVPFVPLLLATIAGVGRELYKPPFNRADLYATIMGGLFGSALIHAIWYYFVQ